MQISIDIATDCSLSLQEQVVTQLVEMIHSGRLRPTARLPGTRQLSTQLKVSRNTVVTAYERLVAEGYLETRSGAGTYVNKVLPDMQTFPKPITDRREVLPGGASLPYKRPTGLLEWDFQLETIDPEIFPSTAWRRLLLRRTQSAKFNMTRYGTPNGLLELRERIASHLGATRGMSVDATQIIIVTGIQQALNVVGRLLIQPGTPVVVEAPGCSHTESLFKQYGAHIMPTPVDPQGLMVNHLPSIKNALAFITSRQFPLGATLNVDRQKALLAWAQRDDCHVLEVDFDSEFYYEGSPPPAMQTIDSGERVFYVGSFATSIGPGLRIGYLVLPQRWVQPAIDALALLDFGFPCYGVPWLEQAVLTDFIDSGGFDAHLRRVRRLYMSRRNRLVSSLRSHFPNTELSGVGSGTHLIWHLPVGAPSSVDLQALLRQHGVGVYTLRERTISNTECMENWDKVLLLGFASQTEQQIEAGVNRIAQAIK